MTRLAIIPARGGSKRIPKKNIMEFFGKLMIQYALEAAFNSEVFQTVHVSTDSEEIAKIVEEFGCKVEFMRPAQIAKDRTPIMDVLQWVLNKYQELDKNYDDVCCLMPNAPLVQPYDIQQAFEEYHRHNSCYPLLAVARYSAPIEWAYRRDNNGFLAPVSPGKYSIGSQDLEAAFFESGPFSIFSVKHLLNDDRPPGDQGFISYLMPLERAIDIDDPEDIKLARVLFLGNKALNRSDVMQQLIGR